MMNLGGAWIAGDGDIVAGKGYPTARDLLLPNWAPGDDQRADSEIAEDIQRLTPHLIRPVRMVMLAEKKKGLFARMMGEADQPGERVDLDDHQAGRPLTAKGLPGVIDRAFLVDTPRLTIALARDFAARGGDIIREGPVEAAYNLTDDQQYPENHRHRVTLVVKRPYREDFAYRLICEDTMPFLAIPLDQDLLLLERETYGEDPRTALEQLFQAFQAWFAPEDDPELVVEATVHDDGFEDSCIQHLRMDEKFLTGLINAISKPLGGSDPDVAPLMDGTIGGNYGEYANKLAANYSHLDAAYVRALVARHGPVAPEVLGECHREKGLGEDFGGGLRAREARWMLENEFARDADDIAERRGPFALRGCDVERLQGWMDRGASLR